MREKLTIIQYGFQSGDNSERCQIYINGKWFNFITIKVDNELEEADKKDITDKEYELIKALRELFEEA